MAGESVVGALRVVLGMDTASFEDGAKKAANSANSFGTQLKAVFSGVGLARIVERVFDTITHAFKNAITGAFEFADNMGKMAQKVGISVEELTGLKVAADLSDVSMESLSAGLGKLSKAMVEAAGGSREAKDKFDAIGISVKDSSGNLKTATQVLVEMADKFEGSKDGAEKVATAMGLLGKGGKELIPLLNAGGGSLKEFAQLAKNMGLEISQNTANQTEKFNDNLKILSFSLQGVGNLVVKDLIPGFLRMSQTMVDTAKGGDAIRATADYITSSFKKILVGIITVIEYDKLLAQAFNAGAQAISLYIDGIIEIFSKAVAPVTEAFGKIVDAIIKRFTDLGTFLKPVAEAIVGHFAPKIKFIGDLLGSADEATVGATAAVENYAKSLTSSKFDEGSAKLDVVNAKLKRAGEIPAAATALVKKFFETNDEGAKKAGQSLDTVNQQANKFKEKIFELQLQARGLSGEFNNLAPGFVEAARGLKLFDESGKGLNETLSLSTKKALELNFAMQQVRANQLTQENLLPWDEFNQKLISLQATFLTVKDGQFAFTQEAQKAAVKVIDAYGQAAVNIVGPMSNAFKTLAEQNKKYAGIAKALAIAEAIVNTFVAANKALISPFGPAVGIAQAAVVTAAGLANVAKISATNFAQGGSFKVGGVGGIDSQLVQFKATPGEMVDVRKPGQDRATSTEVTVRGMKPGDLFTGDMVRSMFDALNAGTRDGYRLTVAAA